MNANAHVKRATRDSLFTPIRVHSRFLSAARAGVHNVKHDLRWIAVVVLVCAAGCGGGESESPNPVPAAKRAAAASKSDAARAKAADAPKKKFQPVQLSETAPRAAGDSSAKNALPDEKQTRAVIAALQPFQVL